MKQAAPQITPQVHLAIEVLQAMQSNGIEYVEWDREGWQPIDKIVKRLEYIWGISAPKGRTC